MTLRHVRPDCYAISIGFLLFIAACGGKDSSGPAGGGFDVRVTIQTSTNTGGCTASWIAIASDPAVTVNYQLGTYSSNPSSTFWLKAGAFTGSETLTYDLRGDTSANYHWTVSAGTWSEDKNVSVPCGQAWQEPAP